MPTTPLPPMTLPMRGGVQVLAKRYRDGWAYLTYANRTQAQRKIAELGAGWEIYRGSGRPFYVRKIMAPEQSTAASV